MKVAFIYDVIYPYVVGGVQPRIWQISKRLAQRGYEVHSFGMKHWDGEDIIIDDGVYLHGICQPQKLYAGGRRSIKEAVYFARKLTRPLLKEDFDIIDCSNFPYFPCFSAKLHALTKKSTLIITWHEVWNDYWYEYLGRKGMFGKWIERRVAHLSQNMIAVSESTKRGVLSIGARGNIKVVPNGVELEVINKVAPTNDKSDVIFAGRLIKEKNIDVLIKSLALVNRAIPNLICLIIGDGPERSNLEKLTHDLGLETNIRFLGFLDQSKDVFSHMKSSKVFVLPSIREGFGIVAVEANACGLPVITTSYERNAAKDLTIDGKTGFLCNPSGEDMAQRILIAVGKKQEMTQSCVDHAKNYDWDSITTMVEDTYKQVISH